jgi:ADP-ribose pyrophosphatase YjhB (NUDIX family)
MILRVGVKAFLKNKEGKYLLVKRAPSKFKGINSTWDIVGGRVHIGTSLMENLKREIKEESGLEICSEPRLLGAQDIFWYENDMHVVRLTYVAETRGEPLLDSQEHVAYKWLTIKQVKKLPKLDKYLKEIVMKNSIL